MFTDQELIAAFKRGDIEALGLLIERHKAALYGYLLRVTGRREAADDVFQEVWLKLARKPETYRERDKFKAWIFTVARNAAMNYFRSENSRRAVVSSEGELPQSAAESGAGMLDAAVSTEPGPHEIFENKVLGEKIAAAFGQLSPEQREIFYLRHYSDLSFREIAQMLGVPIGTVLARMSRATALLRDEFEKGVQ